MKNPSSTDILLSTVFLNWNRADLLGKTLASYASTTTVPHEIFIIDNGSTDTSREVIANFCRNRANCHPPLFLPENEGGKALNRALEAARGRFLHVSENDLEYLPNWDIKLISKFDSFPKLGQVSLYSPFHQAEPGQIGGISSATQTTSGAHTIFVTNRNVCSSSVFRRAVWDKGVRWNNIESGRFKFPDDGKFSADVRRVGFDVAWNDEYVVTNWGHHLKEIASRLPYYLENYQAKSWLGLDGFRSLLENHGYTLVNENGSYQIKKKLSPEENLLHIASAIRAKKIVADGPVVKD